MQCLCQNPKVYKITSVQLHIYAENFLPKEH